MFDSHGLTAQKPTALQRFLERADVRGTILTLIVLNAVVLGLETSDALMARHGAWLQLLDQAMLSVFVLEIGLRLIAWRTAFFRDPWSVFDFAVVAIALVPASGPFAVLRALHPGMTLRAGARRPVWALYRVHTGRRAQISDRRVPCMQIF